jgi:hypothetical protein
MASSPESLVHRSESGAIEPNLRLSDTWRHGKELSTEPKVRGSNPFWRAPLLAASRRFSLQTHDICRPTEGGVAAPRTGSPGARGRILVASASAAARCSTRREVAPVRARLARSLPDRKLDVQSSVRACRTTNLGQEPAGAVVEIDGLSRPLAVLSYPIRPSVSAWRTPTWSSSTIGSAQVQPSFVIAPRD